MTLTPDRLLPRTAALGFLPYIAVIAGLMIMESAWLSIAIYHIGIAGVMLTKKIDARRVAMRVSDPKMLAASAGVCALALPVIAMLWPVMARPDVDLTAELNRIGLQAWTWWGFVAYFSIVHPAMEEVFWRGIMPRSLVCDILFAGYHLLVLARFITLPWLVVCFIVLTAAAWLWRWIAAGHGGLLTCVVSHAVADLAVMLAVAYRSGIG